MELQEQILIAAEQLFLQKGFAMTSTTEIAKKVGCNQALIHYYFRTKENLCQQIFQQKIQFLLSEFVSIDQSNDDFLTKLHKRISTYFNLLSQNERLPFLVFNELIVNEERCARLREDIISNNFYRQIYYKFDADLQREIEQGNIEPIETLDLLLTTVSLTVFTFAALPIYSNLLQKNTEEVATFIKHRETEVWETVRCRLVPNSKA